MNPPFVVPRLGSGVGGGIPPHWLKPGLRTERDTSSLADFALDLSQSLSEELLRLFALAVVREEELLLEELEDFPEVLSLETVELLEVDDFFALLSVDLRLLAVELADPEDFLDDSVDFFAVSEDFFALLRTGGSPFQV